jgi:hypothetical protein
VLLVINFIVSFITVYHRLNICRRHCQGKYHYYYNHCYFTVHLYYYYFIAHLNFYYYRPHFLNILIIKFHPLYFILSFFNHPILWLLLITIYALFSQRIDLLLRIRYWILHRKSYRISVYLYSLFFSDF